MNGMIALARVEFARLLRTRIAFTLLLVVPAMQVLLFGYAIQPTAARVEVVIAADNPLTRDRVADALAASPGIAVRVGTLPPGGAAAAVRAGDALVGIELPPAAELTSLLGTTRPLRVVVDAANPALATTAAARIEAAYWHARATRAGGPPGPPLMIERLYNPDGRADWSFLPALVGVVVMISTIMLGSLSLARERETGTWEALMALPLSPFQVLAGKLLPYVILCSAQGLLVLGLGVALFNLPVRGSAAALIALLPLFAAAHLALGYAIAARAATQIEALQGAVGFYLPAMLLSGFLYPHETLPRWARMLGDIFPLTHLIRAARGATLRGDGAASVLAHSWPIALFLAAALALALAAQRRRLD